MYPQLLAFIFLITIYIYICDQWICASYFTSILPLIRFRKFEVGFLLWCIFLRDFLFRFGSRYITSILLSEHSPRLRRLIDFAWSCTTSSLSVVDLQEKYTGLQLLAHLIAKFQLSSKIAVQVFQCLAKGTHTETKKIVNPALDVLIPSWVRSPSDQVRYNYLLRCFSPA